MHIQLFILFAFLAQLKVSYGLIKGNQCLIRLDFLRAMLAGGRLTSHNPYHPWDWHVYLHLVDFFVNRYMNIPYMDPMGNLSSSMESSACQRQHLGSPNGPSPASMGSDYFCKACPTKNATGKINGWNLPKREVWFR